MEGMFGNNKVALVTGGARRLGRDISIDLQNPETLPHLYVTLQRKTITSPGRHL